MKFNLKNRPILCATKHEAFAWEIQQEVNDWFEGFEKELQEQMRLISLNIDSDKDTIRSHARGQLALIDEILGEASSTDEGSGGG